MTSNDQLFENFDDEPDCGLDAASDQGYWLEDAGKEANYLISWRKKAGMSPELLSQLAPIPLEEYLSIEKGERTMTNGDAWRIDAAIINYRNSTETRFQRSWRRGRIRLYGFQNRLSAILESETWGPIIAALMVGTIYYGFLREYLANSEDIFADFLRSAFWVGIPVCFMVRGLGWVVREWRKMD